MIEGRGDLAVVNLTITPERLKSVDFSNPVCNNVSELIVTGPGSPSISTLEDLAGKEIYVRQSSCYFESLQRQNKSFRKSGKPEVKIQFVSEYLKPEDILEMVNSGIYPITVIDSYIGEFWSKVYDKIQLHKDIPINTGDKIGWAFRKNSPELKKVINEFIKASKKGTAFGNIVSKRYLHTADWIKNNVNVIDDEILPSTAGDPNVNISNISKVENNIHAGVKYLRFILNRYFKDEPMNHVNKHLFAFASYNAGPAMISSLRRKGCHDGIKS